MDEAYVLPRPASIEDPLRIAVLISGGGSGLAALLQYQESEARAHQTVLVLADSQDAGGLEHGRSREIETHGISLPQVEDKVQRRQSHEELVHDALVKADVELVVLSGYMRILTPSMLKSGTTSNRSPKRLLTIPGKESDLIKNTERVYKLWFQVWNYNTATDRDLIGEVKLLLSEIMTTSGL